MFAEDYPFPDVAEGEVVAILNAGGYIQAMSSTHCLRPTGPRCISSGRRGHERRSRVGRRSPADGCRTSVAGDGPGVVLAHAGIADMRQWDPQWEALIASLRVVRYDLRGFGRADVVDARSRTARTSSPCWTRRASTGRCSSAARGPGSIVVDTALEYPDRVSGLAWVCGGSGFELGGDAREAAAFERAEALEEAKDWAALADHEVADLGRRVRPARGPRAGLGARPVRTMAFETYVQEKQYGDTDRARPAGGRAARRAPGARARDRRAGWTSRRRWPLPRCSRSGPGARRIDLPDVAHMPSLERPEWFTETLLAFLAEVDAGER